MDDEGRCIMTLKNIVNRCDHSTFGGLLSSQFAEFGSSRDIAPRDAVAVILSAIDQTGNYMISKGTLGVARVTLARKDAEERNFTAATLLLALVGMSCLLLSE